MPPIHQILGYVLEAAVAVLAWRIARLRIYHRPLARLFAVIAVADPLRGIAWWAALSRSPTPYAGAARLIFEADRLLFLAGPIGLALVAVVVLLERRPAWAHLVGAGAAAEMVLALSYPTIRQARLQAVFFWVHVAAQAVSWASAVWWARRRLWPSPTEVLLFIACAAELVVLLGPGPWQASIYTDWRASYGAQMTAHLATVVIQIVWWREVTRPQEDGKGKAGKG